MIYFLLFILLFTLLLFAIEVDLHDEIAEFLKRQIDLLKVVICLPIIFCEKIYGFYKFKNKFNKSLLHSNDLMLYLKLEDEVNHPDFMNRVDSIFNKITFKNVVSNHFLHIYYDDNFNYDLCICNQNNKKKIDISEKDLNYIQTKQRTLMIKKIIKDVCYKKEKIKKENKSQEKLLDSQVINYFFDELKIEDKRRSILKSL